MLAMVVGACAIVALLADAAAAGEATKPLCGPTRADLRTVRQTPTIRVFERREISPVLAGRTFLCRRGHQAVWSLAFHSNFSYEQSIGRLVGAFLEVADRSGGAVGDDGTVIQVVDTRTGRYASAGRSYQNRSYDELQVTREGIAVWLDTSTTEMGTTATVQAIGPDGSTIELDPGEASSGLRLRGRTATWSQAGLPQPPHTFARPPRYREQLTRVVFARHPPRADAGQR